MSIIYDALKKVETSQANDSKTKIDKDSKSKPKIYLLYALMISLGLFIANIFYGWLSQKPTLKTTDIAGQQAVVWLPIAKATVQPPADKKEPYLAPTLPTDALQASASVETKMETQKETLPPFTLNGVFFSGGEGYALINNRIVKKGDKIERATVVQISLDEVELELDGSIIKLSNSAR